MQLLAKIFYIKGSYKVYVLIEDLLSCFLVGFFFLTVSLTGLMGKYLMHSLYSRNVQILITHEGILEQLISCKYIRD